jgi:hypothetical protein
MTSLYYMTRPRGEFEKLLGGHVPLGEIYLPIDPPRMMETIRKAKTPSGFEKLRQLCGQ